MNNLALRTISGIVLVVILIGGILLSNFSCFVVLSLIGVAALREMLGLFTTSGIKLYRGGMFTIVSAVVLLFVFQFLFSVFWATVVLYLIVRWSLELYQKNDKPIESVGYELFAMVYTILPIVLLFHLHRNIVLLIFVLVWTTDVGAYIIGSSFGKNRLFERISPKKSWEGFWGGLVLSAIVGTLVGHFFLNGEVVMCFILSITISVASVFGDLFESMFKRSIGVKDSGKSIPGHGGFLDRFDALFFAVPAYYAMKEIFSLIFY